jgi:hypothetical protein
MFVASEPDDFFRVVVARIETLGELEQTEGVAEILRVLTAMRDLENAYHGSMTASPPGDVSLSTQLLDDIELLTAVVRSGNDLIMLNWASDEWARVTRALERYQNNTSLTPSEISALSN